MKPILLTAMLTACATAPRPVKLVPPLDSLAFYVGHWQCKGTNYATAKEPEQHWNARINVTPELDGRWLSVTMLGPDGNRTAEHKGYDPATKTWHHIAVINDGSWGTLTSPGWSASAMVFTPDDHTDDTRTTFTKLGERSYSHAVSRDTDHGPEKVWDKVCSKE